jgi:hypothetical protein
MSMYGVIAHFYVEIALFPTVAWFSTYHGGE